MRRVAGRKAVFAWFDDLDKQEGIHRDISLADYKELMQVDEIRWRFFEKEWHDIKNRTAEKAKLAEIVHTAWDKAEKSEESVIEPLDEEDPVGWWKRNGRGIQLNEAIFRSATEKLNPNSMKLAKQLAGELIEKKEVLIGLQPDDYYRIRAEAQRRIQESLGNPDGDRGLLTESSILSQEVCVDNKQEYSESSKVASMAIST